MTVRELMPMIGAKALTGGSTLDREIKRGYACDLLSWVMAHGAEDMAWITVQTHMNVIAVATLHDMACVIIPEGGAAEKDVTDKAEDEGVAVLASEKSAYEISGIMFAAGIGAK